MRSAREIAKGPAPDTDTGDGAARATTRFCAFILAALVAVHLVYLFELGGESLIWSSSMLDLQDRLAMPVADSHGPVGLVIALIGVLLAIAIWKWASLLGALLYAGATGWEATLQGLKLWTPVLMGEPIPMISMISAGLAVLGLLVSLTALFAGVAYRVGRRRSGKQQTDRAEAMALRIRARR